jgi:hypothetical protein
MAAATVPEITLSPEVRAFLQQHQAERAFEKFCAVIRECYPNLLEMSVRLRDDWEIEGWTRCVVDIQLPFTESVDERVARWRHYHERLVSEVPLAALEHITMSESYQAEQS